MAEERTLGRRERKKLEMLRRIREAALELFREKGYEATTVEEIAERADVAKGTFFNHFARKDTLLESLAQEMLEDLAAELGSPESWEGTSREQLLRLFLRLGDVTARDPELSKVMIIENMRNFWLRTEVDPVEAHLSALVRQVLIAGRVRGEFAKDAEVEMGEKLIGAAYVTTMIEWLQAGAQGAGYRVELTSKFDIIFRGLGMTSTAPGGREE